MPVAPVPVYRERCSGLPAWVWGLGFADVAVAVLIWCLIDNRTSAATVPSERLRWRHACAARTLGRQRAAGKGLAAAGGFAAGMLAEKMFEVDHGREVDRGGLQPGMFDDAPSASAAELESRSIDFGNGGDWGGDAAGGGGDDW